jgi:hypothetical protein
MPPMVQIRETSRLTSSLSIHRLGLDSSTGENNKRLIQVHLSYQQLITVHSSHPSRSIQQPHIKLSTFVLMWEANGQEQMTKHWFSVFTVTQDTMGPRIAGSPTSSRLGSSMQIPELDYLHQVPHLPSADRHC